MILELATVLALQGPQCPYLPIVDPPHGKLFCYIWTRLGNPPDRAYLKGINPLGGFDEVQGLDAHGAPVDGGSSSGGNAQLGSGGNRSEV